MLHDFNTSTESSLRQANLIDSAVSWSEWLDRAASAFDRAAAKEPVSERLAFLGAIIRECANQARIHNIQSPGEHRDLIGELRDAERALTRSPNGSAAPTLPQQPAAGHTRNLAGHSDRLDEPCVDGEGDLPW